MVKKKIENKSAEELKQQKLESDLNRLRNDYYSIPEPTYIHNVGDRAKIGALKDVIIEEILDDGKIYKVDYTSVDNNYGSPIITEHVKAYFPWVSVRKYNENTESFVRNRDLILNYSQMGLTNLLSKTYYFGVDFEPEYQRDYVWELDDKVALIDSIYNHGVSNIRGEIHIA